MSRQGKRHWKNFLLGAYSVIITVPLSWLASNQTPLGPSLQTFDEVTGVKVGVKIAVKGEDEYGRSLPKKGKRLIVSMSECDSCSITALDLEKIPKLPRQVPLIMVFPDQRSLKNSTRIGIRTIDTSPSWLPKEMTLYRPQAALIDTNGVVISSAFGGAEIVDLVRGEVQ